LDQTYLYKWHGSPPSRNVSVTVIRVRGSLNANFSFSVRRTRST
jgi:hypothetical protein